MSKRHTQCRKRAFTLVEILVVLAIVAVLGALLIGAFDNVRRSARQSMSISNLHQCWMALRMYCDDNDSRDLPPGEVAAKLLQDAPTCDPSDTWRASCNEKFGPPLIGSYAYLPYAQTTVGTGGPAPYPLYGTSSSATWMASIFYATHVPEPFHGLEPPPRLGNFSMPDRILRLRSDGTIRLEIEHYPPGLLLTWGYLFAS